MKHKLSNLRSLMTPRRVMLGKRASLLAALTVLPAMAVAQPILLDDIFFSAGASFNNNSLAVQGLGTKTTYLKFNPKTGLPAGVTAANISRATLKLYVQSVTGAGQFTVNPVDPAALAWGEPGPATPPEPLLPAVGTGIVTATSANEWVAVDLTTLVKAWFTVGSPLGNGNRGIALRGKTAGANFAFDSKEFNGTSHEAGWTRWTGWSDWSNRGYRTNRANRTNRFDWRYRTDRSNWTNRP